MKTITSIPTMLFLGAVILAPTTTTSWARPPQSSSSPATVVAVDVPTQSLVLKLAKDRQPVVMDWNSETEFSKAGKPLAPELLRSGETITIRYRRPFFGNQWLKKVNVEDGNSKGQIPR